MTPVWLRQSRHAKLSSMCLSIAVPLLILGFTLLPHASSTASSLQSKSILREWLSDQEFVSGDCLSPKCRASGNPQPQVSRMQEEASQTAYGVVGGKAALPCNITPPTPDDAVSLILWYKEESTTPIYSLDARKGSLDQARHASSDSLATRSYFSTLQRNAHLLVENLAEEDAGEYRCRADFRKARTRNSAVFLKVITPPEKPVIKDASNEVLPSLIGPLNEGDSLVLVCETRGGKPRPSLTWWRESALLDDSSELTGSGGLRNQLDIVSLQRHDLMAVFTCQASNNNISAPLASSVTVDLNCESSAVV